MHRGAVPIIAIIIGIIVALGAALGITRNEEIPIPSPTPFAEPTPPPSPLRPSGFEGQAPTPIPTPTIVPVSGPPGAGLSTLTMATQIGNFRATVLSLDLSSTRIITDTASDNDCGTGCPTKPLADYVAQNGGFAGVNGTYFCPAVYAECASKTDSFDFPVWNTRLGKWVNSYSLGWGGRSVFYASGTQAGYRQGSAGFGDSVTAAIINFPGLVEGGNVQIDDNQSGLSDKQKTVGTKVGIGTRGGNNVMVVVAYNVNMQQFAHVFKALGATGALNLDTGGSTALYYQGRYAVGPGRNLPNAVIFAPR